MIINRNVKKKFSFIIPFLLRSIVVEKHLTVIEKTSKKNCSNHKEGFQRSCFGKMCKNLYRFPSD